MGRKCCVSGCSSTSRLPEHHGVTYHSFPLDPKIRSVWLRNTKFPIEKQITKSVLVCSRHFRRIDFQPIRSGKYLLKQKVFPTVFPWGKLDQTQVDLDSNNLKQSNQSVKSSTASSTKSGSTEATNETVEATVAQIMAQTAELKSGQAKKPSPTNKTVNQKFANKSRNKARNVIMKHKENLKEKLKMRNLSTKGTDKPKGKEKEIVKDMVKEIEKETLVEKDKDKVKVMSPTIDEKYEAVTTFTPGARFEALDFDGIWTYARVLEVDSDDREVLIRFEKGGKTKSTKTGTEEWIAMNSTRLRQKITTKPIPVFDLDEKCMARWSGPRKFPATVTKVLENDSYELLFDDGYKKTVRAMHMNKLSPTEKEGVTRLPEIASPMGITGSSSVLPRLENPINNNSASVKKRNSGGSRKELALLDISKIDLASLNLPEIPQDGEWTCHWVNDQPIGKDGFLIVGDNRKPTVIVEDWRLPPDWVKHMYQRSNVLGKWDVILVTPQGKRFRSKADLKLHLEESGKSYNPDIYDFSIHRRRAKDINCYVHTPDYIPMQPPKPKILENLEGTVGAPTKGSSVASGSINSIKSPIIGAPVNAKNSPIVENAAASETINIRPETSGNIEDGYAYIGGIKVQIIDNLFRCPEEGCTKNFRKENHLQIHIKHYHQNLIKLLGSCPKMQELAEKRTHIESDQHEPQPRNQIPNQQFFAKLHQQDIQNSRSRKTGGGPTREATPLDMKPDVSETIKDEETVKDEPLAAVVESPVVEPLVPASNVPESKNVSPENPMKRSKFITNKRIAASRKSNRQRTTNRSYLTSTPAFARAHGKTGDNSFGVSEFEETRHSFNATPDVPKKSKLQVATPLSSLDSPVTADSGSSSFPPLQAPSSNEPDYPQSSNQYIKEDGELIKIVRMRQEEIVNCLCAYYEEDGLMIQCELCLCWQHGVCNGIERQCDVPEKYVCYICRNPSRAREGMRFIHDQDWLYEGRLPTAQFHSENPNYGKRSDLLKRVNSLTGTLLELKRALHSVHMKVHVAKNRTHPKLYLWAKKWDDDAPSNTSKPSNNSTIKVENVAKKEEQVQDQDETEFAPSASNPSPNKKPKIETVDSLAVAPIIPQPEAAIDSTVCQQNLLEHIKSEQFIAADRLNEIEEQINAIEEQDDMMDYKNANITAVKEIVSIYIKELETLKKFANLNALQNTIQFMQSESPATQPT